MEPTTDTAGVAEVDIGDTSPSAVDAVFTDADVRLFSVRGPVCSFRSGTVVGVVADNPVPLLSADGKPIGSARVLPGGPGEIIAEALFQYGCPERLSIETGIRHYFHPEMTQQFLSPGPRAPLMVLVEVKRLILSDLQREDANVEPVVPLSEEESA